MERITTIIDIIGPLNRNDLALHTGNGVYTGEIDGKFGSYLIEEGQRVVEICPKPAV